MIGTNSRGFYGRHTHTEAYSVWYNMLHRCYDNQNKDYKYYADVSVCSEWHEFQNFAVWFYDNWVPGHHLDKDKIDKGRRLYSPDTCCFLSPEENRSLAALPLTGETYSLEDPQGKVWEFHNQSEFARKHNLPRRQLSGVLDKNTPNKIVRGWSIPGTVPTILNEDLGLEVRVVNKSEVARTYDLGRSSLHDLLSGNRTAYAGWILVK